MCSVIFAGGDEPETFFTDDHTAFRFVSRFATGIFELLPERARFLEADRKRCARGCAVGVNHRHLAAEFLDEGGELQWSPVEPHRRRRVQIAIDLEQLGQVSETLDQRIVFFLLQRRRAATIRVVVEEEIHAQVIGLAADELHQRRAETRNGSSFVRVAAFEVVLSRVEQHTDDFAFVGAVEDGDGRFFELSFGHVAFTDRVVGVRSVRVFRRDELRRRLIDPGVPDRVL